MTPALTNSATTKWSAHSATLRTASPRSTLLWRISRRLTLASRLESAVESATHALKATCVLWLSVKDMPRCSVSSSWARRSAKVWWLLLLRSPKSLSSRSLQRWPNPKLTLMAAHNRLSFRLSNFGASTDQCQFCLSSLRMLLEKSPTRLLKMVTATLKKLKMLATRWQSWDRTSVSTTGSSICVFPRTRPSSDCSQVCASSSASSCFQRTSLKFTRLSLLAAHQRVVQTCSTWSTSSRLPV